ncbi:3'-5' exonuclease domain-containing protein [Rhizoctonia solani AG-1 IA]|uniref:3'-5' exonuclease domain-containing protein n=1 Tax=Thanatephorus cucumeris (strain AG1-IA) TaxID=983506 RepID=L8X0V4_THACA|nr:3'-5' exonuclease domain-containing protein [Rhizoctonia solani AG-1 IA]
MPAIDFIDSPETLTDALDSLCTLNLTLPSLFIGMHGIRVSRNGRLCILDIYVPALEAIFMIDITVLDHLAFSTSSLPPKAGSRRGLTLKDIFESPEIPKVFYDVRTSADNLFNAFDISVQGVIDLQVHELVGTRCSRMFQHDTTFHLYPISSGGCGSQQSGLTLFFYPRLSIMNDIRPSEAVQQQWTNWISSGQKCISPELGGNLRAWDERPLRQELVNYCMADVIYLPRNKPLEWRKKIEHEVQARLKLAEDFSFDSYGRHMARAPADWR